MARSDVGTGLDGKVAVITGGQRGLGVGIAEQLLAAGARVVLVDLDKDALATTVGHLGSASGHVVADVTDRSAMEAMYDEVVSRHGRLDLVVANAGVGDSAPLSAITEQQFDRIFGVNVKGALFTVQAALPHLSRGGCAVLVGSTASTRSEYGMSLYGGSKAALRQMMRTWIREVKERGVRINMISPGAIDTPSLRTALAGSLGDDAVDERVREMGEGNWIGRLGTPADIGQAVVYLGSDAAAFVTGIELFVDGGMAQTG